MFSTPRTLQPSIANHKSQITNHKSQIYRIFIPTGSHITGLSLK